MSEHSGFQFTDDAVPRAYDEVLVPRLFEPWALLLLDDADLHRNAVVLDMATGFGTRAVSLRPPEGSQPLRWPPPSRHCPQRRETS